MIRCMEVCRDESVFDWIAKGREPFVVRKTDEPWPGCRVRNLIPDVFESYAKILHRIEAKYAYVDNPLSPEEELIMQIPQNSPLRTLILERRESAEAGYARLRWRKLAEALGVPFAAGITWNWFRALERDLDWPRYLFGPGEGYLEDEEYKELAWLLEEGLSSHCYYRSADIPYIATDQRLLFRGSAQEVCTIPVQQSWNAPEYWWSSELEWCVCSDYDLNFTIVAGPHSLIAGVLASTILEAIEVPPDLRLDDFTPVPDQVDDAM